jgi:hypothetical protein
MSLVIFFMSPLPLLFLSLVLCLNKERLESLVFATRTTHKRKKKTRSMKWTPSSRSILFFFVVWLFVASAQCRISRHEKDQIRYATSKLLKKTFGLSPEIDGGGPTCAACVIGLFFC